MTEDEFYAIAPLADAFPLVFENGARWETFQVQCAKCGRYQCGRQLRGRVTAPIRGLFVIDAALFCLDCRLLNPVNYRLHADTTMSGRDPATGEWSRWGPRRSWPSRLRRFIRRCFA